MTSRRIFSALCAVIALLAVLPFSVTAQGFPGGCFDVDVKTWKPSMPKDSIQFVPPMRVRFESKADETGRLPVQTAPGALGSAHSSAFATMNGDVMTVTWTTGYHGSKAMVRKNRSGWAGSLKTFVDYKADTDYTADIVLTPVKCDAPLSASRRNRDRFSGTIRFASGQIKVGSNLGNAPVRAVSPGKYLATRKPVGAYAIADTIRVVTNSAGTVRFVQMALPRNADFEQQLKRMTFELGAPTSRATSTLRDGTTRSASWASRTLLISLVSVVSGNVRELHVLISDPRQR